jgi:hypothetical protein
MVGPLAFEVHQKYRLRLPIVGYNKTHEVKGLNDGDICFERDGGPMNASPVDTDFDRVDYGPSKYFNILGRDILNQGTLVVPEHGRPAFFILEADVSSILRHLPGWEQQMAHCGHTIVPSRIVPPSEIDWQLRP